MTPQELERQKRAIELQQEQLTKAQSLLMRAKQFREAAALIRKSPGFAVTNHATGWPSCQIVPFFSNSASDLTCCGAPMGNWVGPSQETAELRSHLVDCAAHWLERKAEEFETEFGNL